jgi:sec-independent protein translocase protein TatA
MITGWEWIIVAVIIIAVLLWGPNKLPELARAVGQARREFEKASKEGQTFTTQILTSPTSPDDTLVKNAKELGITTEGKTKDQILQEIVQKAKEAKEPKEVKQ